MLTQVLLNLQWNHILINPSEIEIFTDCEMCLFILITRYHTSIKQKTTEKRVICFYDPVDDWKLWLMHCPSPEESLVFYMM